MVLQTLSCERNHGVDLSITHGTVHGREWEGRQTRLTAWQTQILTLKATPSTVGLRGTSDHEEYADELSKRQSACRRVTTASQLKHTWIQLPHG